MGENKVTFRKKQTKKRRKTQKPKAAEGEASRDGWKQNSTLSLSLSLHLCLTCLTCLSAYCLSVYLRRSLSPTQEGRKTCLTQNGRRYEGICHRETLAPTDRWTERQRKAGAGQRQEEEKVS